MLEISERNEKFPSFEFHLVKNIKGFLINGELQMQIAFIMIQLKMADFIFLS